MQTSVKLTRKYQRNKAREILVHFRLESSFRVLRISQVLCFAEMNGLLLPVNSRCLGRLGIYPLARAHIYDSSRDTKNASFQVLRHTFLSVPTPHNLGVDHHILPNGKISC